MADGCVGVAHAGARGAGRLALVKVDGAARPPFFGKAGSQFGRSEVLQPEAGGMK